MRVFLDPSAHVSFISRALATVIEIPQVGTSLIDIKGSGAPSHMTNSPVRSLTLVQEDGINCEILTLEQRNLHLNVPRVPREVEEKWKDRGICLSDSCESGISNDIDILLGADYVQ